MKFGAIALLLLVPIGTAAIPVTNPCIPDGTSEDVPFTPNMMATGIPVGAMSVGTPDWYDQDVVSDDYMGSGDPLPIENKGGNLSGPSGEVVNGGLDGDCIELIVYSTIRYQVTVSVTGGVKIEPGGVGGSGSTTSTVTIWVNRRVGWDAGEWCPC